MLDQAAAMTAEGPRMELYKKIQRHAGREADAYPLVDQVTIVGHAQGRAGLSASTW